jgi:hypothetical protein
MPWTCSWYEENWDIDAVMLLGMKTCRLVKGLPGKGARTWHSVAGLILARGERHQITRAQAPNAACQNKCSDVSIYQRLLSWRCC